MQEPKTESEDRKDRSRSQSNTRFSVQQFDDILVFHRTSEPEFFDPDEDKTIPANNI